MFSFASFLCAKEKEENVSSFRRKELKKGCIAAAFF